MLKILQKTKGIFLKYKLHKLFFFLEKPMRTFSNLIRLSKWINDNMDIEFNDFYNPNRDGAARLKLYSFVINKLNLNQADVVYLEFGVANGTSFKWWVNEITNTNTQFHGFDTFTGLPEDWGHFKKGDMSANNTPPVIENDNRHFFYQGLFQQTLPQFIKKNNGIITKPLVIHLDADLYTATYYVLNQLAPYLKKGDVIFFDEFNVPNHEFLAFEEFCKSYYINYTVLGAVNNYYQTAIQII